MNLNLKIKISDSISKQTVFQLAFQITSFSKKHATSQKWLDTTADLPRPPRVSYQGKNFGQPLQFLTQNSLVNPEASIKNNRNQKSIQN